MRFVKCIGSSKVAHSVNLDRKIQFSTQRDDHWLAKINSHGQNIFIDEFFVREVVYCNAIILFEFDSETYLKNLFMFFFHPFCGKLTEIMDEGQNFMVILQSFFKFRRTVHQLK